MIVFDEDWTDLTQRVSLFYQVIIGLVIGTCREFVLYFVVLWAMSLHSKNGNFPSTNWCRLMIWFWAKYCRLSNQQQTILRSYMTHSVDISRHLKENVQSNYFVQHQPSFQHSSAVKNERNLKTDIEIARK